MTTQPAIEVSALSHSYGDREALHEVSFSVQTGELFGLLGPNGGGKTTLFRILSTLLEPTAGQARIQGMDVTEHPQQARRSIGVVFQSPSVDGKLTVRENLRHQGHLYGFSGKDLQVRIEKTLERLSLTERRDDWVETLSGGLRRRVELGKGLLHDPQVLLLDEPSTGLDAGARRDLRLYLRELCDRAGVTVLLTTHIMDEAEACDRLAILDRGRLVAEDSPAALKATIGGDVLVLETRDPDALRRGVEERFGGDPTVVGQTVRLERAEAHAFVPALAEAFPGQIDAITLSKPTLEDVFIHRTGHGFWENSAKQAKL